MIYQECHEAILLRHDEQHNPSVTF